MGIIIEMVVTWVKKHFLSVLPYLAIVILAGSLWIVVGRNSTLEKQKGISENNLIAYSAQLDSVRGQSTVFQLKVNQLEYFNDSIMQSLNKYKKELGIKDKNLKLLASIKSHVTIKDSLIYKHDTLFRDSVNIDTTFQDKWHTTKLILKYPSTILVNTSFKSEKYIAIESKKVIVGIPKKFFLLRWFQKKQTILKVTVKDNNPYIINDSQTFVEVLP